MYKPRMIVTDLDGTLLRSDKSVSAYTLSIIERCKAGGVIFIAATGRPVRAVIGFLPDIKIDGAIYHNGAVVHYKGHELKRFGIKHQTVKDALSRIAHDKADTKICVEIEECLFANFDVTSIWRDITYRLTNFSDLPDIDADKLLIGASSVSEMDNYKKYLPDDLYMVMSENTAAMVMHKKATKLNGIKVVADKLGISLADVIAFGDDYNDIDMLQGCGIGVAMENAIPEAKAVADYICGANDNDGVAKWLEGNVLGG